MAQTTLFPLASLPSCATLCGHLYDANGACVPPATTATDAAAYTSCFCANALVAPFSTGTAGVCDSACTTDANGLASIHTWFSNFCGATAVATTTAASSTVGTSSASSSSSTTTGTSSGSDSDSTSTGGPWLSTHWQWVVFIVVVVVGIAGIWIGACIWRRRYLRKKDRQYALSKSLAQRTSTGGGSVIGQSQHSVHMPQAGMFQPANLSSANVYDVEKTRGKRT